MFRIERSIFGLCEPAFAMITVVLLVSSSILSPFYEILPLLFQKELTFGVLTRNVYLTPGPAHIIE